MPDPKCVSFEVHHRIYRAAVQVYPTLSPYVQRTVSMWLTDSEAVQRLEDEAEEWVGVYGLDADSVGTMLHLVSIVAEWKPSLAAEACFVQRCRRRGLRWTLAHHIVEACRTADGERRVFEGIDVRRWCNWYHTLVCLSGATHESIDRLVADWTAEALLRGPVETRTDPEYRTLTGHTLNDVVAMAFAEVAPSSAVIRGNDSTSV